MYIFFKYMDISVKSCYTEHNEKKRILRKLCRPNLILPMLFPTNFFT